MSSRKGGSKVKTGCRTCKTRKVKCDETKPECKRCTTSSRQCAGYEPTPDHGLAWYRPQQLTAHDQREGRTFQFFSRMVGPVLSGPMDSYFWTHLVVQFSHFEPAVRHAVLAISALYEDFHGGARVTRQKPGNGFALRHYGAAIRRIQSADDEQLVFLVCILFICIEYLQGDVEAALRHCKYGIVILNRVGCSSWAREHLMPIFRRLSFASFYFGTKPSPDAAVPRLVGFEVPTPPKFESVAEAQSAIDDLTVHMIEYVSSGNASAVDRQDIERKLQQFHSKLSDFDATVPSSEASKKIMICNMMIKFEMARIQIDTIRGKSETRFDRHTEGFRRVLALTRRASQLGDTFPDGRPKACFTFENGFLPTLGFISIKSRDLQTRLESLALMVDVAAPKEGFVDVGTLYRIGRLGAELEHGISLADGTIEEDPAAFAEFSYPPEEKRFFAAPIDHELGVIRSEDGSVTYRRTVSYLRRDAEGKIHVRQEYITDAIPGKRVSLLSCEAWVKEHKLETCKRSLVGFGSMQPYAPNVLEQTFDCCPPSCDLEKALNLAIAACDSLNGMTDVVVTRPDLCKNAFDFTVPCPGGSGSLERHQVPANPTSAQNGTVTADMPRDWMRLGMDRYSDFPQTMNPDLGGIRAASGNIRHVHGG